MEKSKNRDHRWVCTWLLVGVFMVLIQIMLGGVTRLTGSGLSITKWDIVMGTFPPKDELAWNEAFALYQQSPQYQQINRGMSLSEFRFIFWWEYVHRLWARLMGFVFAIPFVIFLVRRSLSKATIRRLLVIILLAVLAAVFGWIMVASGLINRPWVSAYKLTIHLGLGIALFVYLFYTWLREKGFKIIGVQGSLVGLLRLIYALTICQVILGGLFSGMKAALNFPTWPLMRENFIPPVLLDSEHWNSATFLFYERSEFMPALVQFLHRSIAYLIFGLVVWLVIIAAKHNYINRLGFVMLGIIVVQVVLGILTLTGSIGSIPVLYGSLHQLVGILFLTYIIYLRLKITKISTIT